MKPSHLVAPLLFLPHLALAFCGFYVGGASSKLYNNATQVVLMRGGTKTVLSMQNNYQGPPENFAMVIPVPIVLQKDNVKILSDELFSRIDILDAPRLVEYWEQDPCPPDSPDDNLGLRGTGLGGGGMGVGFGGIGGGGGSVTIEAQFTVGEYEIVILSAEDSTGLDTWLKDNQYNIPEGAEPFLRPYVEQGMKFFVAKVDITKVRLDKDGKTMLSPLRFHYDSETFSLPVRLGLINSSGTQDLIIHILAQERYETANYPNVFIPTNLDVAAPVKEQFGSFYAALFDEVLKKNPKSVVTEYSWLASTCDPCPGPALSESDVYSLGGDVLPPEGMPLQCSGGFGISGRSPLPTVTDGKASVKGDLDQAIIRRIIRRINNQISFCYEKGLQKNPTLSGKVKIDFIIGPTGKVLSSSPQSPGMDQTVDQCVADKIKNATFPSPQNAGTVEVTYPFLFEPPASRDPSQKSLCTISPSAFTLTRLHTRYSNDALGEDLVFQVAKPVLGGREVPDAKGKLEQGATEGSYNNFQARYIIRHPWKGEIKCQNPRRGIWGGPPNKLFPQEPLAARDLAFAQRGTIRLEDALPDGLPEWGVAFSGKELAAPVVKKKLESNAENPSQLPSFKEKVEGASLPWGLLLAAVGGLLLLVLVVTSRPRH